jgi:hypothetical protein
VGTHVLKLTHEHNSIKNVGTHVLKLTHEHLLVSCSVLQLGEWPQECYNTRLQGTLHQQSVKEDSVPRQGSSEPR